MKMEITTTTMRIIEVTVEAVDPIGANKTLEGHIKGLNKEEGDNKIIIEANSRATAGSLTLLVVAINNNYYGNYRGRGGCGHGGNFHRPHACGRGNYRGHNSY